MSAIEKLAQRLAAWKRKSPVEKKQCGRKKADALVERIYGQLQDDPYFEEAMELWRKYRESLDPNREKKKKRANNGLLDTDY